MIVLPITILPDDVGCSLIAARAPAVRRIFDPKKRAPAKLHAMLGNDDLHREITRLSLKRHFGVALPPPPRH